MASCSTTAILILLLVCVSNIPEVAEAVKGFTLELIHRDSPKSPFYNPTLTPTQRITAAVRRSINRANHFFKTKNSSASVSTNAAEANITASGAEYLMEFALGTPPVKILAIADTGSDLIWTQCKPCTSCYTQKDPLFDSSKSSTYKTVSCSSSVCTSIDLTTCSSSSTTAVCEYSANYGDGSFTNGDIATETLTLASTTSSSVVLPKTIIGCGHNNGGSFQPEESGIIGLGGGTASLVTQISSSISGKFSYCLVPFFSSSSNDTTSKLNFGSKAVVSGKGAVSTPLVAGEPNTFYFLTLEAISVGRTRIPFTEGSSVQEGNIIIDSGTTLTLLPPDFYSRLEAEVVNAVNATRIDNPTSGLGLCFKASDPQQIGAPDVTVHFKGADVNLSLGNLFIEAADSEVCFTFASASSLAIYGNLSQNNFLIGYDRVGRTVTFQPADCTRH
ncbi:hypothetical protein FNV43_RR12757 [Rhamnella rubrinervis]|uniref:Peptidase A1 domain-containing protein n=1 Tax=Rhamnella rubrinervis TaxID=2594499 RepID=A0A8K0H8X4_9ROSA|nr:hypothetical protein FNV43_RR12757 [Rhamnella rubrinervis]